MRIVTAASSANEGTLGKLVSPDLPVADTHSLLYLDSNRASFPPAVAPVGLICNEGSGFFVGPNGPRDQIAIAITAVHDNRIVWKYKTLVSPFHVAIGGFTYSDSQSVLNHGFWADFSLDMPAAQSRAGLEEVITLPVIGHRTPTFRPDAPDRTLDYSVLAVGMTPFAAGVLSAQTDGVLPAH